MFLLAEELNGFAKMAADNGPFAGAIAFLVTSIYILAKWAVVPVVREIQPIAANMKETAVANREAAMASERSAIASKDAAEAWTQTARVSSELQTQLQRHMQDQIQSQMRG